MSLEALLDKAILTGFSFGIEKAKLFAIMGELLGDIVDRNGRRPSGERVKSIQNFPPLKDKTHVQQFLGCSNWVRYYLLQWFSVLVKKLGKYLRADAVFPPEGLGAGDTEDDKVVKAIKLCALHYIHLAVLDEAGAMLEPDAVAALGPGASQAYSSGDLDDLEPGADQRPARGVAIGCAAGQLGARAC